MIQSSTVKEGDLLAGRYRLLRRIGAGGMGTVWAARHEILDREIALKIAAPVTSMGSEDARDLFLREVQIIGKLKHPNVVGIADAGDAGKDGLYLAMELLQGESLAQRITRGPFTPTEALAVASEVCRGIAAAHAAGVVHRDLKPENIFLARTPNGGVVPKLLDFGVSSARDVVTLAQRKGLFGTPAYMSPEQALGLTDVNHLTDVWALGVVLYEMLTGRHPFQAESYPALLPLIIEKPYPALPASIPPEVRTVIAGCLAKDRNDRYPSAQALLEAISRARASLPASDPAFMRSGFFVETGRGTVSPLRQHHYREAITSARRARLGLALGILAFPVAIGVAALVTGTRASKAQVAASASAPIIAPEPLPLAPVASAPAPAPAPTATASAIACVEGASCGTAAASCASSATATRKACLRTCKWRDRACKAQCDRALASNLLICETACTSCAVSACAPATCPALTQP